MNPTQVLMSLTVFLISAVSAWAGPERLTDARVMFTEVKDTRTTGQFFVKCEVELKIMGRAVAKAMGVRDVKVTYAVDDTGVILVNKEEDNTPSFFRPNDGGSSLTHSVSLKNPARSAKYIQTLKGTIFLFSPTPENGGMVDAGTFMETPGKSLGEDKLKEHGVTVQYITPEILEQKKAQEKKKARAQMDKEMEKLGEEMGQAMLQMFEGMFGGMMGDDKNSIRLWVKDPNKRVVDIQFVDARGEVLNSSSRSNMGELRQVGFKQLPPPTTRLRVLLATDQAVHPVKFSLNEIPLP